MRYRQGIQSLALSPHGRRKGSADTDSNFDCTTISNNYNPETGYIKPPFLNLEDFTNLPPNSLLTLAVILPVLKIYWI